MACYSGLIVFETVKSNILTFRTYLGNLTNGWCLWLNLQLKNTINHDNGR